MTPGIHGSIACRLCGGETVPLFQRDVLRRHRVTYHQCAVCGLTQTDEPTWLEEAYRDPIHPTDTGVLARNLGARRVVATFLHLAGVRDEPCLDYAGGYGIFTRLMRDVGFEYFWTDPFATNALARGFEWTPGPARPRAVTAFEVLEHLVRPLQDFRKIASYEPEWIITSTELHPGPRPAADWPYLSVESGQHVAFYRPDTLARLGREAGYPHVISGPFFQVFGRKPVPREAWRAAVHFGAVAFPFVKKLRPSFTVEDCERIRARLRGE